MPKIALVRLIVGDGYETQDESYDTFESRATVNIMTPFLLSADPDDEHLRSMLHSAIDNMMDEQIKAKEQTPA